MCAASRCDRSEVAPHLDVFDETIISERVSHTARYHVGPTQLGPDSLRGYRRVGITSGRILQGKEETDRKLPAECPAARTGELQSVDRLDFVVAGERSANNEALIDQLKTYPDCVSTVETSNLGDLLDADR